MAIAGPSTPPLLRVLREAEPLAEARPSAAAAGRNAPGARLEDGVQRARRWAAADRMGAPGRRRLRSDDGIRLPPAAGARAVALRRDAGSAPRRAIARPQCARSAALALSRRLSAAAIRAFQTRPGAGPGRVSKSGGDAQLARISGCSRFIGAPRGLDPDPARPPAHDPARCRPGL